MYTHSKQNCFYKCKSYYYYRIEKIKCADFSSRIQQDDATYYYCVIFISERKDLKSAASAVRRQRSLCGSAKKPCLLSFDANARN